MVGIGVQRTGAMLRSMALAALLAAVAVAPARALQQEQTPLVPGHFELAEPAKRVLEAEWLTDEERRDLRLFHGVWEDEDLTTPTRQAVAALNAWRFDDPALTDPAVPVEIRAEALLRQGALQEAIDLLAGATTIRASRIRAEALEGLGRYEAADRAIDEPVQQLLARRFEDAASLTEGVRALIIRSRLRGQPARDFQTMMNLLGLAREQYDRLYWPAMLTEAELLLEKDNRLEAIQTLHQVLSLNPRNAEAWYQLGMVAVGGFDFESARRAAGVLQRMNPDHPLASLLLAEVWLTQNDPEGAREVLDPLLEAWPMQRDAMSLRVAATALEFDEEALAAALEAFDEVSPGSAQAHYDAGRILSFARQYEHAAEVLSEAVRRQPNWPAPQIELALLELQSGRDALALEALRRVRELDPFNKRVANSLYLLEELMMNFAQVETEHFIIRFSPETEDRALVELMGERLEAIHKTVATRFEHEPDRKTIIEVMPNHEWFAVRIGGMPFIHTIAACTGPVIAMEVPREGAPRQHYGLFDWPRVLQHEYTHTITLSQTRNRIPHWLTEAAAVSMEMAPRDYRTVRMLVDAFETGRLFDLDQINWAFIRPKRPGDRSLAYAQGHWMVEFMNERFGESALIRLLEQYFEGHREHEAMQEALGVSREAFYDSFLEWAAEQVLAWGFGCEPTMDDLVDELRQADPEIVAQMERNRQMLLDAMVRMLTGQVGEPNEPGEEPFTAANWPEPPKPAVEISDEQLAVWLDEHPDHPDLLKLAAERAIAMLGEPDYVHVPLLERYAELRPSDPWPHRALAQIWRKSDQPERAIPHLEELDVREEYSPVYAQALADLYRANGDLENALAKIDRAVNIDPYNAPRREAAASMAIESGDLELARTHIKALTILEPGRPQHERRLEAIERMIASRTESN